MSEYVTATKKDWRAGREVLEQRILRTYREAWAGPGWSDFVQARPELRRVHSGFDLPLVAHREACRRMERAIKKNNEEIELRCSAATGP